MNAWIKSVILPVVCLVIFIAVMIVYVKPQRAKINEMQDELDILLGKGDKMVPIEKIMAQEAIVDSLRQLIEDVKDRLYPVAEFGELGEAIENSGRRFNLRLVTLTPDYSKLNLIQKDGEEITELPITIDMEGRFLQFAQYLERLSEFPYVKAREVNLYRSDKKVRSDEIVIEVKGVVIFKNKLNQKSKKESQLASAIKGVI